MLVLFLGSNIGNFDAPAAIDFLRRIRLALRAWRSAAARRRSRQAASASCMLAYDDPLGVTAAFNRNLLVRINRELGGTFDLDAFDHRAALEHDRPARSRCTWSAARTSRSASQPPDTTVTFARGEHIWTESSYKYGPRSHSSAWAPTPVSRCREQWIDDEARFALTLFAAA